MPSLALNPANMCSFIMHDMKSRCHVCSRTLQYPLVLINYVGDTSAWAQLSLIAKQPMTQKPEDTASHIVAE